MKPNDIPTLEIKKEKICESPPRVSNLTLQLKNKLAGLTPPSINKTDKDNFISPKIQKLEPTPPPKNTIPVLDLNN
jgi:hypothetical protein